MDAVLVIDKPVGPTSFDVVRRLRRAARTKRVGHGGTLDPAASGVLPICLGEATKLAQFLLKNNREWNDKAINDAMNAEKERFVKLTEAVPVFIYYYTAWVDEAGVLQLRKDIYRHDADMEKRLI